MRRVLKRPVFALLVVSMVISALLLPACGGDSSTTEEGKGYRYSYWKGDIPNTYYRLDIKGNRGLQVTGKPFMKLEYDPVSGVPLMCEFGLSETTQDFVPGHDIISREPTLNASSIDFAGKLDLKSPVDLLVSWGSVTSHQELSGGGFEFWCRRTKWEEWHFVMTFDGMEGEVKNLDNYSYLGGDSDTKAIKLLRKFNAND